MEKLAEKNWYVVNTYSGREKRVQENLKRRAESMNLQSYVFRIIVAEQEQPILRNGIPSGKVKMKNLFPGYIFVEMIMTDEAWYMVRNTPDVTGFVGSSGKGAKPFPVAHEQIETVLKMMGIVDEDMYKRYEIGDRVKVLNGSFMGTEATITDIDAENGVVTVELLFFGRLSKVEIEFSDIAKI